MISSIQSKILFNCVFHGLSIRTSYGLGYITNLIPGKSFLTNKETTCYRDITPSTLNSLEKNNLVVDTEFGLIPNEDYLEEIYREFLKSSSEDGKEIKKSFGITLKDFESQFPLEEFKKKYLIYSSINININKSLKEKDTLPPTGLKINYSKYKVESNEVGLVNSSKLVTISDLEEFLISEDNEMSKINSIELTYL